MTKLRFGIAARLFLGIGILTLAIVVVGVSYYQILRGYQKDFDEITTRHMPTLNQTAQLGREMQAIVGHSSSLITASSEYMRQSEIAKAHDEAKLLAETLSSLSATDLDPGRKERILALLNDLIIRYDDLLILTKKRIDRQNEVRAAANEILDVMAKLPGIRRDAKSERVSAWAAPAHEMAVALWRATLAEHAHPLQLLRLDFARLADKAAANYKQLPASSRQTLDPINKTLIDLGIFDNNVFDMTEDRIHLSEKIAGNLEAITYISDNFLAETSDATYNVFNNSVEKGRFAKEKLDNLLNNIVIFTVCGIALAALILYYTNSHVVARLRSLMESMHSHAAGETAPIDISGSDEISDMARSLQFFVNAINSREDALIEAKESAEHASHAKTKFLAAASHDLRQPLQALSLFVATLKGGAMDERTQMIAGKIEASVFSLQGLLDTLLDISKLDAGVVRVKHEHVSLRDLFGKMRDEFEGLAMERGLKFRLVATAAQVETDPELLETVLRNFLANAIKYTKTGAVLLGCRHREGKLLIQVHDTGIGIAADQLPHIFEDFHQVGNQARNRAMGLGLGLAIVHRIAALLGYQVTVSSVPEKGSVFSLEVPLAETRKPLPDGTFEKPLQWDAKDRDILVVEDDESVQEALGMLIEQWGCRIRMMPCIRVPRTEACGACTRCTDEVFADGNPPPDLILADFNLQSNLTGIEAVEAVRRGFRLLIPAILLTGETTPSRMKEVRKSGLPVLHKPLQPDKLKAAISEAMGA